MPMIIGGVGVLVLIVILVMVNSGGDDKNDTGGNAPAKQPEKPRGSVPLPGASAGNTPDRPAPPLTQDTLDKMAKLLAEAKAISNSGFALLKDGKNMEARTKQSEAKVKIDQIKALIEEPSLWYEEADMGEWSIPAEYVAMNRLYSKMSTLQKTIRMQGGK